MSVIHHTPGAPTLCTLPPECILVIISHLPPSTYTPLVQTSHHFLAFFSTHAATICNNHILTHHALSASYLNSIYLDGWLVPSHPAIAIQERLLLSPPALHIYSEQLEGRLLLSSPGPQYLKFLEQYDFEIRTRREMADREFADLDDASAHEKSDKKVIEHADEDYNEGTTIKEGIEERFTYMVGTYAVRFFLRKMDDIAGAVEERRVEEARRRFDGVLDGGEKGVGRKAEMKLQGLKKHFGSKIKTLCKKLGREKRELCFGEIESDDETEKGAVGRPVRDGVMGSLLWYYSAAGVLAFREREKRRNAEGGNVEGTMKEIERLAEKKGPMEKRVERVKIRVRKALRQMATVTACFGTKRHFESLD